MIKIFNRDCMEMMKEMPDKAYELAIVDPIYGVTECGYREANRSKLAKTKKYHNSLWNQEKTGIDYFLQLMRVSKNQIVWGGNYFAPMLQESRCWIVWDKDNSGDFADCELAWASFRSSVRKFKFRWNGMLQEDMSNKEFRIHPTQKPVALYKWLLKNYAKPGDKILDTHLGSGSSAIAAYDMGFDFTGYEIDVDYFAAAKDRLERHMKQGRLFDVVPRNDEKRIIQQAIGL